MLIKQENWGGQESQTRQGLSLFNLCSSQLMARRFERIEQQLCEEQDRGFDTDFLNLNSSFTFDRVKAYRNWITQQAPHVLVVAT